jgi:hypothetical protein
MPYKISRDGSEWVVKKRFGGKVVGKHDSREKAVKQIQAIHINERPWTHRGRK